MVEPWTPATGPHQSGTQVQLKDLFGDKLDVQIYLQCSSMGCFKGSEALQFRDKSLSAVRGLYFPAHSFEQQRNLALAQ